MNADGKTAREIAPLYGVTDGRISQIVSPNWHYYLLRSSMSTKKRTATSLTELKADPNYKLKENDMPDRKFEPYKNGDPADRRHAVKIHCSVEGCPKGLVFYRHGIINPKHAAEYFRNHNWEVGSHPKDDRCPTHVGAPRKPVTPEAGKQLVAAEVAKAVPVKPNDISTSTMLQKPGAIVTEIAEGGADYLKRVTERVEKIPHPIDAVTTAPSGKPLEMTLTDRRKVVGQLNNIYSENGDGYQDDWTDDKVALVLSVPKEWVTTVREENFGPELSEQARRQQAARLLSEQRFNELRALSEQVRNIACDIDALRAELHKKLATFDAALKAFEEKAEAKEPA
jgi:hypothetical protein